MFRTNVFSSNDPDPWEAAKELIAAAEAAGDHYGSD